MNQWLDINGKYYYFGADGYMWANAVTPDGYLVGADGAWIQDNNTQNELPTAPYAGTLDQYRGNKNIYDFEVQLAFKKADLVDQGSYYELKNAKILYTFFAGAGVNSKTIYQGTVYVYKTATKWDGTIFEDAVNALKKNGTYYWTLSSPDEKGYFTKFTTEYTG